MGGCDCKDCECCLTGPCGSEKCGCFGCSYYRIRAIALIILCSMIEMEAMSYFWAPLGYAECGNDSGDLAYTMTAVVCSPDKMSGGSTGLSFYGWWNDALRDGPAQVNSDFKDSGDAIKIGGDFAGLLLGLNGICGFLAMMELLGFTLGSMCQGVTVTILGFLGFLFGILGGGMVMGAPMMEKDFVTGMCNSCFPIAMAANRISADDGMAAGGAQALFWAGIMSIGVFSIGINMACKAKKEIAYVNVAPDRNPGGGPKGDEAGLASVTAA